MTVVDRANKIGMQGLAPHLIVLLDMPVGEGLTRKKGEKPDRFEKENQDFHRRVREGYLKLAAAEPRRWLIVDATKSKNEIAGIIWERVSKIINRG